MLAAQSCVGLPRAVPAGALRPAGPKQPLGASSSSSIRQSRLRATRQAIARRQRGAAPVAAAGSAPAAGGNVELQDAYEKLKACRVFISSTGQEVSVADLWSEGERAVLVFGRSMG